MFVVQALAYNRPHPMTKFQNLVARLHKHHGDPSPPPAHGPFELVMWENACYLLPDERRAAVFGAVKTQVGMTAEAIRKADSRKLLPIAALGGMRPETRVFRWHEIARITLQLFGGNLDSILQEPYAKAKKALKQFPNIGEPGAEKILLLCGMAGPGLPLESNGLRVLVRAGYGREHLRNYGAMYKSVEEAIASELPRDVPALAQAHMLLREHGKTVCRTGGPLCHECPATDLCAFAQRRS